MVYHSNITDQIRGHVVYLGAKGKYSLRKIAEKTGVSKSTVRRILSKSKNQPLSAERRGSAYNRGVFFVEEYTKMNGAYFRDFVSRNFPVLFHGRECRKMFIMDNDPSQTSTMALKAIKDQATQGSSHTFRKRLLLVLVLLSA